MAELNGGNNCDIFSQMLIDFYEKSTFQYISQGEYIILYLKLD